MSKAGARQRWDHLHTLARYCPRYPDDVLVRWALRSFPERPPGRYRALDLGCGAGRNALFLAREGFETYAVDISDTAVEETRRRARVEGLAIDARRSAIDEVDFGPGFFDAVVSYGVLCYATREEIERCLCRVAASLRPGGRFFCMTRSDTDWRVKKGTPVGPGRYRLESLAEDTHAGAEEGMEMTFLDEASVRTLFGAFSRVDVDRRTVSWFGRSYVDDDWLIGAVR